MSRLPLALVATLSGLALAGCSSTGNGGNAEPGSSTPSRVATGTCDTGDFAKYVGQAPSVINSAPEAQNLVVRQISPGGQMTMDYNPGRVNVEAGEDGLISNIFCG